MKRWRKIAWVLSILLALSLTRNVFEEGIETPVALMRSDLRSSTSLRRGPFTRGPNVNVKRCIEYSPWSHGWGQGCGRTKNREASGAIRSRSKFVQDEHSINRQPWFETKFLKDHLRAKVRRLTALVGGVTDFQSPAYDSEGRKRWGKWRTPGNSNAYLGMREPVRNDNPFGSNVLFRESDNDVNISEIESAWYNPLIDSWKQGLPHVTFHEDDISVPCSEDAVDCSPVKVNFPVSEIHTPYAAFADYRSKLNETEQGFSRDKNMSNTNQNQSSYHPSDSWHFELDWPQFGNFEWPGLNSKPSYPKDSIPWHVGSPADDYGPPAPKQPNHDNANPHFGEDIFVPAQPIVAQYPPHLARRKNVDPVDKFFSSSYTSPSQGTRHQAIMESIRSLPHTKVISKASSGLLGAGAVSADLLTARRRISDLSSRVGLVAAGLRGWDSTLSRDFYSVQAALREPPQRFVQAALDKWIVDATTVTH